eukprot:7382528-Prymnesium_polylepis.2
MRRKHIPRVALAFGQAVLRLDVRYRAVLSRVLGTAWTKAVADTSDSALTAGALSLLANPRNRQHNCPFR